MTAVVADHALGLARGAGGVKDVKRIGRQNRNAIDRLGAFHGFAPIDIAPLGQFGLRLRALQNNAAVGLVFGQVDGAVQQRHVFDDAVDLDAAGRGDDQFGLGVVNAYRQLVGRKPAENDRMDGANAGAG